MPPAVPVALFLRWYFHVNLIDMPDAQTSGPNALSGHSLMPETLAFGFTAERREPPGRARLRVGCLIGQLELGR